MSFLSKLWRAIRKPLAWIAAGAALLFAIFRYGEPIVAHIRRVLLHRGFRPVKGDPTRIDIENDGEYVRVKLPDGVRSDEVIAAGVSGDGEWAVEVNHVPTHDRRGAPRDPGNPFRD